MEDSARPRSNVSDIKPIRYRGRTSPNTSINHSVLKIPIRNSGFDTGMRSLYAFSSIPKIRRCRSSPNSWKKFCATAHILSCFPLGLLRKEECINDHFVQRIGRVPYLFSDFLVRAAIVTFPLFFNLLICLSIYCLQCRPAFILSLSMGKSTLFRIRKSGLLSPKFPGLTRQSPLFRTQKSLVSRLTQKLHDCLHLSGCQRLLPFPPTVALQLRL